MVSLIEPRTIAEQLAQLIKSKVGHIKISPSNKGGGRLFDQDLSDEKALRKRLIKNPNSLNALQTIPNSAIEIILEKQDINKIKIEIELLAKKQGLTAARDYSISLLVEALGNRGLIQEEVKKGEETYFFIDVENWQQVFGERLTLPTQTGARFLLYKDMLANLLDDLLPKNPLQLIFQKDESAIFIQAQKIQQEFGNEFAEYYIAQNLLDSMSTLDLIIPVIKDGSLANYELTDQAKQAFSPLFEQTNANWETFMVNEILRSVYTSCYHFGLITKLVEQIENERVALVNTSSSDKNFMPAFNEWLKHWHFPSAIKIVAASGDTVMLEGLNEVHDQELLKAFNSAKVGENTFNIGDLTSYAATYWTRKHANTRPANPLEILHSFEENAQSVINEQIKQFQEACKAASFELVHLISTYNESSNKVAQQKKQALENLNKIIETQSKILSTPRELIDQANSLIEAQAKITHAIAITKEKPIMAEHRNFLEGLKAKFLNVITRFVNFIHRFFQKNSEKEAKISLQAEREGKWEKIQSYFSKPQR